MQLDYRQFVLKLERLFEVKPVPYQDYVSQYIKAYYIPETDLEAWVSQHSGVWSIKSRVLHNSCHNCLILQEYTAKQLVSLVNCVAYSNNKTRQKLNSLISDLSGRIRR